MAVLYYSCQNLNCGLFSCNCIYYWVCSCSLRLSSEITKGAMYVFDDVHIIWGGVENGRPAIVQESVLFRLIYCILKKFYIYNIFWEILVCHI